MYVTNTQKYFNKYLNLISKLFCNLMAIYDYQIYYTNTSELQGFLSVKNHISTP